MIVGHTKFAPDAGFGLIKQKHKKTNVKCLQDIVEMVNNSAAVNEARLVGTQDEQTLVPTYEWSTYLGEHFKKVPNIKQYHQFNFVAQKPGRVLVKRFSDSEQLELDLRKRDFSFSSAELPPVVHPKGLSEERQWYLFEKIRPFCSSLRSKDLTCPHPTALQPQNCSSKQVSSLEQVSSSEQQMSSSEQHVQAPDLQSQETSSGK